MREMKDSGVEWIGEIPNSWGILPLARILAEHSRKNIGNSEQNVLSLSYGNIIRRDVTDNMGLIPESFETYNIIEPGHIVLRLTDLQNDQRSLRTGLVKERGIITSAYLTLTSKLEIDSRYYHYLLHTYDVMKIIYNMGNGVRQNLKFSELAKLPLPIPAIKEQHRIADYLDAKCAQIDRAIARQQEVIEKLKEYKLSVITETVTKGLNPNVQMKDSGIEWIGEIPEHWEMLRLRYVGTCQNGISKDGESFGSGYPFISYSDVDTNFVVPEQASALVESSDEERTRFSVCRGDVFFTRTSETIEEIGLTAVCLKTIDEATFAGFLIRVRPFENTLQPEFSKYYFRSEKHRRFFVKEMNLITRASLGQELLKQLPVLLPPKKEQQEIAEYLDEKCLLIESVASGRQQVIDKLTGYKKSLIYEVVTGKREV